MSRLWVYTLLAAFLALPLGCGNAPTPRVVVYTALDEMYSRPILEAFEKETGIAVAPVYDTEASKTTGLVTRLIAEKDRPRADVFWNNETAQTIVLKEKGILEPYVSPEAAAIPANFKDPDGYWAGFAARGRVIIYNTNLVTDPPKSIEELTDSKWRGKAAIAMPLFGTTATHAAVLFSVWGGEKAKTFFTQLKKNGIAVLPGNATVRDKVAEGVYAWGLTDTDDANGALEDGKPAKWLFPDQDGMGALIIPNTVALIKNAPNPDVARKLIDYLLRPQTEARLAAMRSVQIPLKPGVHTPATVPRLETIRPMTVDFAKAAAQMEPAAAWIKTTFVQ